MSQQWQKDPEYALHYAVSKRLNGYARGVDRRDWSLLESTFHEDAHVDYGFFRGTVAEFVAIMRRNPAKVEQMMHSITNVSLLAIDPDNQNVLVESYCMASQRLAADTETIPAMFQTSNESLPLETDRVLLQTNRYIDLFTERESGLRIAKRQVIYEWYSTGAAGDQSLFEPCEVARRDNTDATYASIAEFLNK